MKTPRAFTLIELLAATALSVVLMVAVLTVIAGLSKDMPRSATPTEQPHSAIEVDDVVGLLREDFEQARYIEVAPKRLKLMSYGFLDVERRRWQHRPVEVTYALEQIGQTSWLVRQQRRLDVLTNQNLRRDLVCANIDRWQVEPIRQSSGDVAWRVKLWQADSTQSLCDRLLAVRYDVVRPMEEQ